MEGVDIGKANLQNYLAVVNKIEYDLCIPYVMQFFSLVYTPKQSAACLLGDIYKDSWCLLVLFIGSWNNVNIYPWESGHVERDGWISEYHAGGAHRSAGESKIVIERECNL